MSDTLYYDEELSLVTCEEELLDFFLKLDAEAAGWKENVEALRDNYRLDGKKVSIEKLTRLCGYGDRKAFSPKLIYAPAKRSDVIKIAICLGVQTQEEVNYLLKLCKHSELYPLVAEDAIWIYLIKHQVWDPSQFPNINVMYQQYEALYGGLVAETMEKRVPETEFVQKSLETEPFEKAMVKILNGQKYRKLFPELKKWHRDSIQTFKWPDPEEEKKRQKRKKASVGFGIVEDAPAYWFPSIENAENADEENIELNEEDVLKKKRAKLRERVKEYESIPQQIADGMLPSRNRILGLLLQYELTMDGVNNILEMAKMPKLYSKDYLDSTIIYVLSMLYDEYYEGFSDVKASPFSEESEKVAHYDFVAEVVYDVMTGLIKKIEAENSKYKTLEETVVPILKEFIEEEM